MEIFKVSSHSPTKRLAGAIANVLRDEDIIELHAIGPAAVSQATKAVAIARGWMAPGGFNLIMIPTFIEDSRDLTGIRLTVKVQKGAI